VDFDLLIRNAQYDGRCVDVRIEEDRIVEIGEGIQRATDREELDAHGGALLPGLHDHHLHLFSLAASLASIDCGPPDTPNVDALRRAIDRAAPGDAVLRGTNYFESVAGPLDRDVLDRLCPNRPIRIQHRSGSMWFLNSRAIDSLNLSVSEAPDGAEIDATGRFTGRFFRLDDWLRKRLPRRAEPDLAAVGALLARRGVTGVTDATPTNGPREIELFRGAQESFALPQRLYLMGTTKLEYPISDSSLAVGPVKILLDEPILPELSSLVESIREAHSVSRSVAIHTVTRSEIHFALAAIEAAGARPGDRLEHASIAPPEAVEAVRRLGLRVVTQPNFVAERGDAYVEHVEVRDRPCLYRLRSWLDAGVPLGGGTDAPFGRPDPWRAMRAAVDRAAASGQRVGPEEALSPEQALALFLNDPGDPGGVPRVVEVGAAADLCLLDRPWQEARDDLDAKHVAATFCRGRLIFRRRAPGDG
jgi:predicted amidohydrolase YtcJ